MNIIPHSTTFASETEQIMTMVDGSSNQIVDIPGSVDATRTVNDSTDNSLGAFFARPVKIANFDWTPGAAIFEDVDPWTLYLSNKRVVNKLATYKLLRANMKIKVMINGNSFFYGRVMMSYLPYQIRDELTLIDGSNISFVQFSQMPRILIDPTLSQGGEMSLPFFYHNDYLDVLRTDDKAMIGRLLFHELTPLKHTSGDTSVNTRASITVYAWMENVQLEAPTATNPFFIVPQSTPGYSGDKIPAYCMPSSMSGGAPSHDPTPQLMEPRGISSLCLTDVPDTSNKLTFTSGQEGTIDPRILGLSDQDEMSISHIASKESYLTSFDWTQARNTEDLLFNLRVTPAHYRVSGVGAGAKYYFTASCGAVLPFRYWNGTFKVRFQFVTSAFHRGRVAIVYDPHATIGVREDNAAYTHIVDISSCRDVVFKVGPNQDRQLLTYYDPPNVPAVGNFSTSTALPSNTTGNGTIAVYVINELTLPNATPAINNDIKVNVFVSMDTDFETFVPGEKFAEYTITPQSTGVDAVTSIVDQVQESAPYDSLCGPPLSLDQPNPINSDRHKVYVGERMLSFRHMLKRYYHWMSFRTENIGSVTASTQLIHRAFPAYRGQYNPSMHKTLATTDYNYVSMTLLNFLQPAYSAWRGSIRYKMFPRNVGNLNAPRGVVTVAETYAAAYNLLNVPVPLNSVSTAAHSGAFAGNYQARVKGVSLTVQAINHSIEYEIPWWETMRFAPGKVKNWVEAATDRNEPGKGVTVLIDSVNTVAGLYDTYVSVGEDFSMYFFTGWPPMYWNPTPPAPSVTA